MMDRSLLAHGAFAIAASVAAYAAWKAPETTGQAEEVVVVAGDAKAVSEIRWHDDRHDVTVRRAPGDDVQVTVVKRPAPAASPDDEGQAAEDSAAQQPGEVSDQTFPGTAQAKELFAKVMPLKASRMLGKPTEEENRGFGLDTPKQSLVVVIGGKENQVELGGSTYGTADLYARSASGDVFLLPSKTISQLRYGASALLDRNVLGVEVAEIERIRLRHGAIDRELIQRNAEDKDKAFFADPADPEQKLERLSNLVDRALRLRVTDFAAGGGPTGEPELVLELFTAKGPAGKLEVWKSDEAGASARSSRFGKVVRLSRASADHVLRDLADVLSERPAN